MNFSINSRIEEIEQVKYGTEYEWNYLFAVVLIPAGGLFNILICLAVWSNKKLQIESNYVLLSFVVAELLVNFFVIPLRISQAILGELLALHLPLSAL